MKYSILFIIIFFHFFTFSSEQASSSYSRNTNCGVIKRLLFGKDTCDYLDELDKFNQHMVEVQRELEKLNEDLKKTNE